MWAVLAFRQHRPFSIKDFSGCVAAQILELGGIDSTNSAVNIGPGLRICAVVGGAGGTGVIFMPIESSSYIGNLRYMSGKWVAFLLMQQMLRIVLLCKQGRSAWTQARSYLCTSDASFTRFLRRNMAQASRWLSSRFFGKLGPCSSSKRCQFAGSWESTAYPKFWATSLENARVTGKKDRH